MSEKRGFAVMDEEEQREIASKGGRAAHESGNAHEFDSEEAAEAGRKGGEAVSRDREHMAEIGAKGGLAAHHSNAAFYHETASHHHRQAAKAHRSGDEEEGNRHGEWRAATARPLMNTVKGRGAVAASPPWIRKSNARSCREGGRASHQNGRGHEFDEEEASEAGRKGGRASHGGNRGYSGGSRGGSSEQHAEAGRKGGLAKAGEYEGGSRGDYDDEDEGGTRGGSSEQHARAGRQSHKNR